MEVLNLKAYLANIGMKLKDFCEILDVNDKYMSKIMNGHRHAGHRLAKDVRLATDNIIHLRTKMRRRDLRKLQEQEDREFLKASYEHKIAQ